MKSILLFLCAILCLISTMIFGQEKKKNLHNENSITFTPKLAVYNTLSKSQIAISQQQPVAEERPRTATNIVASHYSDTKEYTTEELFGKYTAQQPLKTQADNTIYSGANNQRSPQIVRDNSQSFVAFENATTTSNAPQGTIDIYQSTNGGSTWVSWSGVNGGSIPILKPQIVVTQTHVVVTAEYDSELVVCRWRRADKYFSFVYAPTPTVTASEYVVSHKIVSDIEQYPSNAYLYLAYLFRKTDGNYRVLFSHTSGTDSTWSSYSDLGTAIDQLGKPTVGLDYGGYALYVSYLGSGTNIGKIMIRKSVDFGSNWTVEQVLPSNGTNKKLGPFVAANGSRVVVTYQYDWNNDATTWKNGTDVDVYATVSTDAGASWNEREISATTSNEILPSITHDRDSSFYIAFLKNSNPKISMSHHELFFGPGDSVTTATVSLDDFPSIAGSAVSGTKNAYLVWTATSNGLDIFGTAVQLKTPPFKPSNFTASAASSSQINLTWQDKSSDESGFRIYRSIGSAGNYQFLKDVAANTTSTFDAGLTAGTLYYYAVRSFNSIGYFSESIFASATTSGGSSTPTISSFTPASGPVGTSVTINGTNLGATQGSAAFINTSTFISTAATIVSWSNTQVVITVPSVSNGTYQISLGTSNGTLGTSTNFTVGAVPASPTSFLAIPVSSSQANLTWTASGTGSPTLYRIYRSVTSGSGYTKIDSVASSQTSYSNIGLTANTIYWYRVTAINASGESSPSNEDSAKTFVALTSVPSAPTSFLATPISKSQANLSWTASATGSPTLYRIYRSATSGSGYSKIDSVSSSQTSYSNTGLTANTVYWYRVSALNSAGESSVSNEDSAKTFTASSAAVISIPTTLAFGSVTPGTSLQKTLTIGNTGNAALTGSISVPANTGYTISTTTLNVTAGSTQNITVTFSPLAAQNYNTTITVTHNAVGSPSAVALSGTGLTSPTPATIAVSSASLLIMKNGTTGTFSSVSVTVANGGQQTLTGTVAYSGTSLLQLSSGSSLSVVGGSSTQITIQHNILQTLSAGTYTGNITIAHNAAGGTTTIPVELRIVAIPATISINKTITFTNPENSLNYQLVSVPGTTTYGAASVLQGEHKTDWRLYRDNGAATNYLVEYNGSSAFNFGPGKGFWLLSKKGLSVSAIVNSATSTTGAYAVALQSGWNIISTPYEKSVSWNDVKKYNSLATNAVIYGWSNGVWTQALSMSPYKAYYYNNIPNAASILIPYDPSGSLSKTVNEATDLPFISSRAIQLSLSSNGSDIASVYAGFDSTSCTDYDNNDYFAPPQAFATSSIVIENDAPHMPQKRLYVDHRKEIGEGQIFNLAIHNSTNSTLYLTANGMNTIPNDEVYLYNVDSKMSFNLKEQQHVVIPSTSEELHYQLIIGSQSYIEKKGISLTPTEYALFQNYPNPFNPTTIVSYSIPAEGHVVLKLYDILGHEIKTIINEYQTPGNYVYQIDGRTLATGVYFYTIRAGAFASSKKMLLMK